jgi:hypothetical protein
MPLKPPLRRKEEKKKQKDNIASRNPGNDTDRASLIGKYSGKYTIITHAHHNTVPQGL